MKYEEAYENLEKGVVDEITVAYNLIFDNKQKKLIKDSLKKNENNYSYFSKVSKMIKNKDGIITERRHPFRNVHEQKR
jgi:hypothetical protein